MNHIYTEMEHEREKAFQSIWSNEIDAVFSDVAEYYDRANMYATLGLIETLRQSFLSTMDINPGAKVLDVCAGTNVIGIDLLKKRPEIVELCHRIKDDLKRHMMAVYDDTAAIGKLYRRQDEIGTPWCVTVDVDSLEDGAVTVRDRDSMAQERVPVEGVTRLILDRLEAAQAG